MKSVEPKELMPHRVFFTEFDRYNSFGNWNNHKADVERQLHRKIKLLLLTKGHLVVAASQLLESPFAHDLILKHPKILNSGSLISSMKYGHDDTVDFLNEKRMEQEKVISNPYHTSKAHEVASAIDTIGTSVRWNLSGISTWFRDRLASDINDSKSLLRVTLSHESILLPNDLSGTIAEQDVLSRGRVEKILKDYNNKELNNIVLAYSDFIYYLSGARTTNSEGILPQENLVDFSIGDLLGSKTKLSDSEIFFKIFIDTVKAKTSTVFPVDFLDAITIEDAIELREIAISKKFIEKYNTIQVKTKEALNIHDPQGLVLLMGELEQFESELFREFSETFDKELPTRIREEKKRAIGNMLHSVASLFIPGYSPESYKEIFVSGLKLAGKKEVASNVNSRVSKGLFACESMLENMNILDKQVLLDFVDEMKKKYVTKLF